MRRSPRLGLVLLACVGCLLQACYDNPADFQQRIVGTWQMAGLVAGKPANGVLHILPEGNYILDNRDSDRVAVLQSSGEGYWSLLRDELELLALQASPLSDPSGLNTHTAPARLLIVALNQERLVTSDPTYGVRVEWVRITPLN